MKRIFAIMLATCTLLTQGNVLAFAAENTSEHATGVPEGIVLNYKEAAPVDSSFAGVRTETSAVYGNLPTSYSASAYAPMEVEVRENHDAGVREQNPYGTCWAHSAMSIAESSYIINEGASPANVDFNEYHLVHYGFGTAADSLNLFGNDYNSSSTTPSNFLQSGGNNLVSLCMLASWHGASDVSQNVYGAEQILNEQTVESVVGYDDAAHMQNGYVLTMPDLSSNNYMNDMNIIKQMIMEYGSVSISYYAEHSPEYFQASCQYYPEAHETNHSVTVVGWDDSVPASKFKIAPPGDGAWIVKNSWGSDWNYGGYFYLSYYDATIAQNAFAFDFVSADNYDNNYQYDGTGNYHGKVGGYYGQITAANAFVADSNETLEAVGFFTRSINNEYEIRIYRGLAEGANPNTGTLVWTQNGSETYVGYHTVELNTDISLEKGERYAVVITLKGAADEYMFFPADAWDDWGWVSFWPEAKAWESYVGADVESLADLNPRNTDAYYSGKNVRIKAFTNERTASSDVKVTSVKLDYTTYEMEKGQNMTLHVSVAPTTATNPKVNWTSSNPNVATVDQYGNVTAVEAGTAVITATAQDDGGASASCTFTVTKVMAEDIAIVVDGEVRNYYRIDQAGNTMQFVAVVTPSDTTNKDVVWTSSNPAVATIDENGLVRAVSRGMTIITATTKDGSNLSASCLVAVQTVFVDSITLMLKGQEIDYIPNATVGETYDLDCQIIPEETAMLGVKWSSSNPSVAMVDQNGVVKILSEGNTVIDASVTVDGFAYKAECYIEAAAGGIQFAVQHYVMNTNGEYELAETEYITSTENKIYTYQDFAKDKYNDWKTFSFVSMKQNGYPINMYYAQDGDTVQMYYERLVHWMYIYVELDEYEMDTTNFSGESYYAGSTVNIDMNWIRNLIQEAAGGNATGALEVYDVVVEGNLNVTSSNGTYSFTMPAEDGAVLTFKVREKISYDVEHYVMNASGGYTLAEKETFTEYRHNNRMYVSKYIKTLCKGQEVTFSHMNFEGRHIDKSDGLNEKFWVSFYNGNVLKIYYTSQVAIEGWNQADDGNWYYYTDGKVDTSVNGLAYNQTTDEWWYAVNGKADFSYTGLTLFNDVWFYVENGILNWNYTGLVQYYDAWFYVEGGSLNWNYTGLVQYNGIWFYVQGGQLNWGYTGLVQHYDAWFYVEGGQLNWNYTGLTLYNDIWFYVQGGQLNWGYIGLVEHYGAWFYVEGGMLNWNYTGLAQHYDAWFYIENGQLNWGYTGLCQYNGVWFYVENGQLNWGYTGLVQHYDAWFYVENGVLNWGYTGLCQYNGIWFYIENGQLNWGFTGNVYFNGIWWYVENGILVGAV